ncbi:MULTISPECIES: phosphate ABC transporter permease PstA [Clostridium]|jgi:phosphate transport system permease protein|uniref:phosphate ABC transporter permease PstA n=1 Tax=Clostridium TaxID=1485 RepID=UPI000E548EA4|nr:MULTISPECIES: phosphate ABC transporter permease PstA [Clostridium]RHQ18120.1 phosphate ABC transporter permease PtsA [Clostridium sp. AM48-13]RHQ90860.1 phosphate ABC transporter permease PtsA [Clostridium sp. AF21-20LB]RHU41632.1 phosphate ABC transporter permease PtsA [Clostridium sp. TF11-13AC]
MTDNRMKSIYQKRTRIGDNILKALIYLAAGVAIALLVGIMGYVFVRGLPQVSWQLLSTVQSSLKGTFGILGNIINTIYIIVITLIIAAPIGIGSAIYLNEYAKPGKLVRTIEFTTEILSGIPSIIFGLFGMVFFGMTLKLGYSVLTGSFTLTLMVLPLITRNTQEALKTVPDSYRSGALGIGATKWYMIRTILLPSAAPGILTGVILSIGRIVGESAALLFTAGSGFQLPKNLFGKLFESSGTLTIQLYLSMQKAKYDQAFGIAVVLLIIVLGINLLTRFLTNRFDVTKLK